jgi:hypothetical protein
MQDPQEVDEEWTTKNSGGSYHKAIVTHQQQSSEH